MIRIQFKTGSFPDATITAAQIISAIAVSLENGNTIENIYGPDGERIGQWEFSEDIQDNTED